MVDEDREWWERGECGPGCPIEANAWKTDETLRVTHDFNQKEMMIALKLHGIMASSLLLIALMVKLQGISGSEI